MHKWLVQDHPLPFYIAAIFFAGIALALTVGTSILAQETSIGNTDSTSTGSTSTSTVTACSYSYSNWSACQSEGKRYRSVTDRSPSGCVQTSEPDLVDSCSYTAPSCNYAYTEWGNCQSSGKQNRSLISKTPVGCEESPKPILEQNCTYTNTTTFTATTTQSTTTCTYSYSDWGNCQSDGKRYRSVTTMSPTGCVQSSEPKIMESCTYTAPTTTSTTTFGTTGTTTSATSIINTTSGTTTTTSSEQCLYTYSSWSDCQSNGKRTRKLVGKSPFGCVEYVKPVFEQSCVYDVTTTQLTTTGTPTSSLETTTSTGTITPNFSFVNVTDGQNFSGMVEIRGSVAGALSVEYYLVPKGSNTFRYIGSARLSSVDTWVLSFRSQEFPNGEFYLRAKIKNQYGEYGSSQKTILITNSAESVPSTQSKSEAFLPLSESETSQRVLLEQLAQEIEKQDNQFRVESNSPVEKKQKIVTYCEARPEQCSPSRDTDQDGLSDIDEIRYGTDPKGADSDLDGFIDGDEVKNGFNPVQYSPGDQSDRIVFESPKTSGETKTHYKVRDVVLKKDEKTGKSSLQLEGIGLPNSFVTIYIYSDPIVLTVKTDSNGNWTYALDKELGDGQHEVYVAVTDNTGKITGKSEPLGFIKTAQAVTVIPTAEATAASVTSVAKGRTERDMFFLAAIMVGVIALALALIGLAKHHHIQQKERLYLS